jgi:hypothetical protein
VRKVYIIDLVKHPDMQLASKDCEDVLDVFLASHLSAGDACMQLVTSFCQERKFEVTTLFVQLDNVDLSAVFTPNNIYLLPLIMMLGDQKWEGDFSCP